MKEKIITIKVDGTNPGQWSNLLLELNIMKKAWRSFGVNIDLKAPGIKSIIEWGNKTGELLDPGKKDNGFNNSKRRIVSISSCYKTNNGKHIFNSARRLHGPVRDTKTKTNRIR